MKRALDIIAGLLGCCILLLLYPIIAILIKLDSKGSVIYKQVRVGCNRRNPHSSIVVLQNRRKEDDCGRPFQLYKFRTMVSNAEVNGPQLCSKQSDTRITRVGWWLRYLHIDEIPQFWNVLRGEMSLIGPRPERPFFTRKYCKEIPHYEERNRYIKPGLTGLAQITLGYDESLQTVHLKYVHDINYRIASSSFSSWFKMEVWIVGNTIRYLWNHIWKDIQKKFSKTQSHDSHSPTSTEKSWHHIAHPWKLIDRITDEQEQSERELPSYAKKKKL